MTSTQTDQLRTRENDLAREATNCSQCGYGYDLQPLVDESVERQLGQYFGDVKDRSKARKEYDRKENEWNFWGSFSKLTAGLTAFNLLLPAYTELGKRVVINAVVGVLYLFGEYAHQSSRAEGENYDNTFAMEIKDRLRVKDNLKIK